jgi:glycosyltransferase involved in cell wall biosynthesis
MGKSLKIAIYSGEIPSTTFIERLIIGLSLTEHTVFLFGPKTIKVSYNNSIKVVAYAHNRFHKLLHLLKYTFLLSLFKPKDKRKLDQILRRQSKTHMYDKVKSYPVLWHRPDIFHLQWAKGLEEWAWVQEFGITLVLSLRGAHINYSPIANLELAEMYQTYFPKVDAFHAVSKEMANEAQKYGAMNEKVKVIYSGLSPNVYKKPKENQDELFKIISVGRPHWIKGYNYALDACKILKVNNFEFSYAIIGGSSDIEFLYQVHDLGLQDDVTLLHQKPYEEVQSMIHSADLLLLPSQKEGIANVVLEAMSLGTLVLSTDCGGIEEVITNGKNGFIVPIRDSKSMADKIMEISNLSDIEKSRIKKEALKTIQHQHTEAQMVQDMLELYENSIN